MRRANGTGSIVNLGPNRRRRYAVRVSYLERPGLWRQKYLSYHRTAREAQDALDKYLAANKAPQVLAATWGEVYEQWSAKKYQRAGAASVNGYKASWGRLSALEHKPMLNVTIDDLQAIIDEDERKGMSKSSIYNDKMLMKAMYKYALEREIVSRDLSAFVELPSVGVKVEKGALSEAHIDALRGLAEGGFPYADTALILCYTGFRVSELLALTPSSYHPEGQYLQGGMKTAAGRDRIVPIHPAIRSYIEAWLAKGGERIICGENGKGIVARTYRNHFSHVAEKIGVPQATPHWCRHTAASRMKLYGVDDLAIKRILGHADANVTEHYTHVDIDFLSREIRKVR